MHVFKSGAGPRLPSQQPSFVRSSLPRSAVVVAIVVMVSAWFIVKTVALAPLTSVYAQYGESPKLPLLLDATGEELTAGLEVGHFTSVDLVHVSIRIARQIEGLAEW
jgi:amidase